MRSRLLGVLGLTLLLCLAPVVTPVWASARPVAPVVHTTPLGGVDAAALAAAPSAFEPAGIAVATPAGAPARPTVRVDRTTQPAVFTTALTPGAFTAAGVSWTAKGAPTGVVVQVRIRDNGAWNDWEPLGTAESPDVDTAEGRNAAARVSTEPIVSPDADAIQVRIDAAGGAVPTGIRLTTIDAGTSPADANLTGRPSASAQGATARPAIITRAQWGADERLLGLHGPCPGYSSTVKVGFVHHTVSTNAYTAAQSAALVRGIYAYHVQGNSWCDMGYNFLVDRYGQAFEGRHGGIDKAVLGAHTLAFNRDSFSVSGIGDYSSTTPSAPMLQSIANVIGWKLGTFGRDPRVFGTLTSSGGPGARWPAGTPITFPTVAGHRDAYSTECPGNALYVQLQNIRNNAAAFRAAHTTPDADLYAVLGDSTGSGRVEVHAQSRASTYASRMSSVATTWADGNPEQWRFLIGSTSGDTRPDLIGVHLSGTASRRVEVRVASWASGYQDTTIQTVTPVAASVPDVDFEVSAGGPGGGDLYFVQMRHTASRTTEVHSLTAASGYTAYGVHSATALPSTYSPATARLHVAKGSGDLYLVLHGATGSRRTEVHVLSASSRYRTFTAHSVTPLGPTSDAVGQWLMGTASTPDLSWVPVVGTGSRAVEVHTISAASRWTAFSLHAATNLPAYPFPRWQFGIG